MKLAMLLLVFHETSLHLIFQNSNSLLSGLVSLDVILKHVQIISEGQITPQNSVRDSEIPGISQNFLEDSWDSSKFAKDS